MAAIVGSNPAHPQSFLNNTRKVKRSCQSSKNLNSKRADNAPRNGGPLFIGLVAHKLRRARRGLAVNNFLV